MIKIDRFSCNYRSLWNEFLADSKNSTFLFNRDFVEYHYNRFNDYSLMIFDKGILKGILPANIDSDGILYSHQGLTYGGFVFKKDEKLNNILRYIYTSLKFLSDNNIKVVEYKSFPKFYNTVGSDEIDYAFFIIGANLVRRDLAMAININDKISYQERRIRAIKKAKKAGVQIIEEYSFDDFWTQILTPNLYDRFGVNPVHTLTEINLLKNRFPKSIRQFNAYINKKIIAGTTIFETPSVAHAQYISANDEGKKNDGIDLLFSHLIESEFKNKNYFDFGICNENQGKSINFGLLDWKEGFGGRSYSHDFYKIETIKFGLLDSVIKW